MKTKTILLIAGIALVLAALVIVLRPTAQLDHFSSTRDLEAFLDKQSGSSYDSRQTLGVAADSKAESGGAAPTASSDNSLSTGYSSTNVQVHGVDEPDIVKTDGEYIYIVSDRNVTIVKSQGESHAWIVTTLSYQGYVSNIFIKDDRLVVFGQEAYDYAQPVDISALKIAGPWYYSQPKSFIKVYDITDRASPQEVSTLSYDGTFYDARMIGSHVYVIVNQPIVRSESGDVTLPAVNEGRIAATDIAYLPIQDYGYQLTTIFALNLDDSVEPTRSSFLTGYTQTLYVSEDNIYLTAPTYVPYESYQEEQLDTVIIPLLSGDEQTKAEEIRASDMPLYEQEQAIGVVISDYYNSLSQGGKEDFERDFADRSVDFEAEWAQKMQRTTIHKLSIEGDQVEYVAKGEVPGYLLNQFSLDESDGYLRVATTTRNQYGGRPIPFALASDSPDVISQEENHVYVLNEDLSIVGSLEHIAPNEQIYSARFMGDRLYLVTFKQIDPLFVIDLGQPTNPRILGQLKIPGFSTYLHPFDETHVIGIGQDTDGELDEGGFTAAIPAGLKLALFDVSDPSDPFEVDRYIIGDRGTYSDALYDHKAFLFNPENGLLVLPVTVQERIPQDRVAGSDVFWYPTKTVFEGAYVFTLDKNEGFTLRNKITHLSLDEQSKLQKSNPEKGDYFYAPYDAHIRRSLYIGDTLYTISQRALKATSLSDYQDLVTLELPHAPEIYYMTRGFEGEAAVSAGSVEAVAPKAVQ